MRVLLFAMLIPMACLDIIKTEDEEEQDQEENDSLAQEGAQQGDCYDGIDNDNNGFTDCEDQNCYNKPACQDDSGLSDDTVSAEDLPVANCSVSPNPVIVSSTPATWDGSESYDPNDVAIVSFQWELLEKPEGSEAVFDVPYGAQVLDFYADIAGDYVGQLTITNADGLSSSCETILEAIPPQALWVEIFWQHAGDDMDLHLLAPGGILESDTDCYYANCKAGDPNDPWYSGGLDWGVQGVTEDDPVMDQDDISDVGPENITIQAPEMTGEYKVVVHDYPGSVYQDANDVTLNIYSGGELIWTDTKAISGEDTYTEFATINWGTQTITGL